MSSLSKTISLVAAAAAVTGGPSTAVAQAQRGGGRARNSLPRPHHQSDDRALRSDGDATTAATVPEVASIVNGTSTGGSRPFMVGLASTLAARRKYEGIFTNCSGTLINPTTVLTAAQCMYDLDDDGVPFWEPVYQVFVNLYDKNEPAGVVTINIQDLSEGGPDIVVHPDWDDDTFENDIALIFLPVGQVADYAQINNNPNVPAVPDLLRVMGWGDTLNGKVNRAMCSLKQQLTTYQMRNVKRYMRKPTR